MDAKRLLSHVLEATEGSDAYFVSGSLSFLPRLGCYREPEHDVDVALSTELYLRRADRLTRGARVHVLRLPEVALADQHWLAYLLPVRTDFVHVWTRSSMVDAFNHLLREKMIRADPRVARLFERYAELHGRSAATAP